MENLYPIVILAIGCAIPISIIIAVYWVMSKLVGAAAISTKKTYKKLRT